MLNETQIELRVADILRNDLFIPNDNLSLLETINSNMVAIYFGYTGRSLVQEAFGFLTKRGFNIKAKQQHKNSTGVGPNENDAKACDGFRYSI